jgi:acyl-CoA thioester hydrolase
MTVRHARTAVPHTTTIPVSWGDTDAGGLIYYPRFFHYTIVALNDYFAPAAGGGHLMDDLRRDGLTLPAVDASGSFSSPLRAGETARVETTVTGIGDASLTVGFVVVRGENDERAAELEVTFVLVDDAFEATSLPEAMRQCVRERGDG